MRAALLALALFACARTDPGSGTGTLFAVVEADGRPDSTRVRVELKSKGNPVIGANVVIEHVETGISMNLEGIGATGDRAAFRYEGTFKGHARTLALRVVSGEDELSAQLEGPAPHVITRPPNDAIVRRAEFERLTIRWEADDRADLTVITTTDLAPLELDGDPFEAEIPLGGLRNGPHTVEVRRETRVDLLGGTAGSVMRARYTVDNRFTLEG